LTSLINTGSANKKEEKIEKMSNSGGVSGGVYGLAFIGALVYYLQHAANFKEGVIGFFKALLWPAILIYKVLQFLKM